MKTNEKIKHPNIKKLLSDLEPGGWDVKSLYDNSNPDSYEDVALKAIEINVSAIKYVSLELKKDQDFLLKAIKINACSLNYVFPELKKDQDFLLKAIKINVYSLNYVFPELKKDKEFFYYLIENLGTTYVKGAISKSEIDEKLLALDDKSVILSELYYQLDNGNPVEKTNFDKKSFARKITNEHSNSDLKFNF
jgi:hypothetical protein